MIPTDDQWESMTEAVVAEVNKFLMEGMPTLEEEEPEVGGHPVAWLLQRARTFDEWNRPHRLPTHPKAETLTAPPQHEARKLMATYAKRVARATVPVEKQTKAARRNFAIRTTKKLSSMAGSREVLSFAFLGV